jgi:hypothetical protein
MLKTKKYMKRNQSNRSGICRLVAVALLAWLLLPADALFAQVKINHGVDMAGLFTPNNFVYFGHFDHATELTGRSLENRTYADQGAVKTYEGADKPILWRVMGLEAADTSVTLLSEYVLDSRPFGAYGQTWNSSAGIYSWLHGTFATGSFTGIEQGVVHSNPNIYAPAYNYSTMDTVEAASSYSTGTKFYLPWGTPNQISHTNANKVFWTIGAADGALPAAGEIPANIRGIGLKGKESLDFYNVYYWLRTRIYNVSDYPLVVKSDEAIDLKGIGESMGVRPIFKLDTAKILFAAELKEFNSIERVDQVEDNETGGYIEEDKLPNGGSGGSKKAYKLTLLNSALTIGSELYYDIDDTAKVITDTVAFKPGEAFGLRYTGVNTGKVAYKIVSDGGVLEHYGFRTSAPVADTIRIVADDINTEFLIDASGQPTIPNTYYRHLNNNSSHSVYVWAQQDYPTRSNEGSTPLAFTMKVLDDDVAPVLVERNVQRSYSPPNIGESATVIFNIAEANQAGKYYYVVDPTTTPPPSADDIITLTSTSPPPFPLYSAKIPFTAAGNITINLANVFQDNNAHHIYIVAKDQVRNVSNVLHMVIPPYVPNTVPVAKNPVPVCYLMAGEVDTVRATDIADDPDPYEVLQITAIVTGIGNSQVATASLTADSTLRIVGVAPGVTDIAVRVDDHSITPPGPSGKDTVTIQIVVREPQPQASIDYVAETLTGLSNGVYVINGDTVVVTGPALEIADNWFGATLSIAKVQPGLALVSSVPQQLPVPARPAAPDLQGQNESFVNYADGWIIGVNTAMEYKPDTLTVWTPISSRNVLYNLAPGTYHVRSRVIPGQSFVGATTVVTILPGSVWTPIQRMIALPDVKGVTSTPPPGVYHIYSTDDFSFALEFRDRPMRVTTSRIIDGVQEELTGTANDSGGYDYVIRWVQGPVAIYIDMEQGNVETADEQSVWAYDGHIYVRVWREDTAAVYGLSGQLIKQTDVSEGTTSIPVERGIYIVALKKNGAKRKVAVK